MTVAEAIRQAVQANDAREAGKICEFARFQMGMNYNGLMRMVTKAGVDPLAFEGLLQEAEALDAHEQPTEKR
jgi:hypothetical protein